ncbi:uncharacterized protein [Rutidosis leptorrhynchoides]|uniref:uncharacterized protein n=1 Tax=Rutidosis leptorrhynchoides TaxID=125765 RepID=UPI003A98E720
MGKNSGGTKKKTVPKTNPRALRNRKIGFEDEGKDKAVTDGLSSTQSSTRDTGNTFTEGEFSKSENYESNTPGAPTVQDKCLDDDHVSVYSAKESDDEETHMSVKETVNMDYVFPELPALKSLTRASSSLQGSNHKDIQEHAVNQDGANQVSYAKILGGSQDAKKVNFRYVEPVKDLEDGIDVEIPLSSVLEAKKRYNNTLYGYFLGKRIAYPVVRNYGLNVWKKFGIENVMMNSKGFFFFKFATEMGMHGVLENGPWIIRSIPIILNEWSPDIVLTKEELGSVPVWIKLHDVPLAGFTADGLSVIASNIGTPMMLDSYTSTMCNESWGRPNYARAMIEVKADTDFKETVKVAIPSVVKIEYEWKPPRCSACLIFGHMNAQCSKNIVPKVANIQVDKDGFTVVGKNVKQSTANGNGFVVGKPRTKLVYLQKGAVDPKPTTTGSIPKKISDANSFDALKDLDESVPEHAENDKRVLDDEESDLETHDKDSSNENKTEGASTPVEKVVNVVHCLVTLVNNNKRFYVSVVYAKNYYIHRRSLWDNLFMHTNFVGNHPWVIMGDFNVSLDLDDSSAGGSKVTIAMREFRDCVDTMRMTDVNYFGNAYAIFQPYRISDHCPAILKIPSVTTTRPKSFKFSNFIVYKEGFDDIVLKGWCRPLIGYKVFRVVKKLRDLKKPLWRLMWQTGNLHTRVIKLKEELDEAQQNLDRNPNSIEAREDQSILLCAYNNAVLDEERFLKQKAKIEWLRVGDSNSAYFHKVVKGKIHRIRIATVFDRDGISVEGPAVANLFVNHYMEFLGTNYPVTELQNPDGIFTRRLSHVKAFHMICPVSSEEIKSAIFDIGNNKSQGGEITEAVRDFFVNGQLLTELNHTVLSLIPKVQSPCRVTDFRPIACCNVLYKCNSKIITNHIKDSLDDIVGINQSAFVPGRRISDNILLTQELMRNYHLSKGTPRCAFKVDIQKAYDTVSWSFLESILFRFGFHRVMVRWIMKCVTSVSFSLNINGELHGYFKGNRGLRQGDPMSPYLFTLVMEVLSMLLVRNARDCNDFRYHPKCEDQEIINLCFADDLFMFSHADLYSIDVISRALDEFKACLGLVPSMPKSIAYFSNVSNALKSHILAMLPFEEGSLPVKYLGVPLVSTQLHYRDCKELVDVVSSRINNWKNKFLSFAGRLQLINSVLSSTQIYWQSVFLLPSAIINDIEALIRGFLWCQGNFKKSKVKVKWEDICIPKIEGGLGIKRLKVWNVALLSTHICRLLSNKESLWDIQTPANASWSWRNILCIREVIRGRFFHEVGNGNITSAWFDYWCSQGPLSAVISRRVLSQTGYSGREFVHEIVDGNAWNWPHEWFSRFPILNNVDPLVLSESIDLVKWKATNGEMREFSVNVVWETIRPRAPCVDWYSVVWFSNCIPKHAFVLWLLMGEKLKTQDKLNHWEICPGSSLVCPLCEQVWNLVSRHMDFPIVYDGWRDFRAILSPFADRNIARIIIVKLLFAASVYCIWNERNARFFKKRKSSCKQIYDLIYCTIHLKIMSIRWKSSPQVLRLKSDWKIS